LGVTGTINTCLWFDEDAEAAARHYVGIFADSAIGRIGHYGEGMRKPAGTVLVAEFTLRGHCFIALNGGPGVPHSDAISLQVDCGTQAEIDHLWQGLLADGGRETACGWLKDKFGISWQIVPRQMAEWQRSGSAEQVQRMMQAMMGMVKLDIAALEAAFEGTAA
jgi:predicted 3-demethylubiquinone-9 3-methyltransferase (glyoxalase superfamily)